VTGSQADLCTFLRAHELVKPFIEVLSKVYFSTDSCSSGGEQQQQLLCVLVAQLLSTLLTDILNAEFTSEETIRTLLSFVSKYHPLAAAAAPTGVPSATTELLLATPPVRAIRARKGKASPASSASEDATASAKSCRTASSLAFRALRLVCSVSS
jgi:hypothetical protein